MAILYILEKESIMATKEEELKKFDTTSRGSVYLIV